MRTCTKPRSKTPQNSPFIGCAETSDLIRNSPLNDLGINPIITPTIKPRRFSAPSNNICKN